MGRSPCCDKIGLKKGPWTPEEDEKLLAYVQQNGHGSWRALPLKAGLQRCGKSCRLRWINYLRPDIKRGKFSLQEEQTIIQLHALLGNRWSAIATHLPKRTDNEIKNYWNTHLKKRLAKMGLDPLTHRPKNETLALLSSQGQAKNTAKLSHMAQWESARLEAEARLATQSKLHNPSPYLHGLKALSCGGGPWEKTAIAGGAISDVPISQGVQLLSSAGGIGDQSSTAFLQLAGENGMKEKVERGSDLDILAALTDGIDNPPIQFPLGLIETPIATESERGNTSDRYVPCGNFIETFTDLLRTTSSANRRHSDDGGESDNSCRSGGDGDYYEGDGDYWDSVLNLVNSSPSDSPVF